MAEFHFRKKLSLLNFSLLTIKLKFLPVFKIIMVVYFFPFQWFNSLKVSHILKRTTFRKTSANDLSFCNYLAHYGIINVYLLHGGYWEIPELLRPRSTSEIYTRRNGQSGNKVLICCLKQRRSGIYFTVSL